MVAAPELTAGWSDSVTGGACETTEKVPILVTPSDSLHPDVDAWLRQKAPAEVVLLGGDAALSSTVASQVANARRVFGTERAGTAAAIATELWGLPAEGVRRFVVVNGYRDDGWQFGLAAGGLSADARAPMLLVDQGQVPVATADLMRSCGEPMIDLLIVGSSSIIDTDVKQQLDDLDGGGC